MTDLDNRGYEALVEEVRARWASRQPDRYESLAESLWEDLLADYVSAGDPLSWISSKEAFLREITVGSNSGGRLVSDMRLAAARVAEDICGLGGSGLRRLAESSLGSDYPDLANAAIALAEAKSGGGGAAEQGILFRHARGASYDLILRAFELLDGAREEAYNAKPDEEWLLDCSTDFSAEYGRFDMGRFLHDCENISDWMAAP